MTSATTRHEWLAVNHAGTALSRSPDVGEDNASIAFMTVGRPLTCVLQLLRRAGTDGGA